MAEWFDTSKLKPLADNTHGRKRCIVFWPLVALDDDGDMTDKVIGGVQHIVDYESVGNGGMFCDPDNAEACGDYFGDDHCYAAQPSHWAACIANPDGSDTSTNVKFIDGERVDQTV